MVDRRTKPGRKRSVAEGDGGDAAPAANVKVRQQTRGRREWATKINNKTSNFIDVNCNGCTSQRQYFVFSVFTSVLKDNISKTISSLLGPLPLVSAARID